MNRRTVHLVERRTRELRLPSDEIAFLLAHASHLLEIVPTLQRGTYRLTPRGVVGWFVGPTFRYAVRPKVPWPTVRMLLGLRTPALEAHPNAFPDSGLLDVLASEFAERLRAVLAVGLVSGYHDRDTAGIFLRGKLRAVDQLRDAAARAFPDRFHVTESAFDLDTPWNRIPRSLAEQFLANPDLGSSARDHLCQSIRELEAVSLAAITDADFTAADAEPRAAHYRPLLALCRLLYDAFAVARLPGADDGAFLIDLSRAFERYLTETLTTELSRRPKWSLEAQPVFAVDPTELQPDILVRRCGSARLVLDAKWKAPGLAPTADDLHQILAYATVTGSNRVGLVYPGRRFARREFSVPGTQTRVSLFRVRVVGTSDECARSITRLARVVWGRNA